MTARQPKIRDETWPAGTLEDVIQHVRAFGMNVLKEKVSEKFQVTDFSRTLDKTMQYISGFFQQVELHWIGTSNFW